MSRSPRMRLILPVAGLLLVAGVAWWYQTAAYREMERELAGLASRREVIAREARAATARVAAAARLLASLPTPASEAPRVATPAVTPAPKAPTARTLTEIIASDPTAEVLMLRWQREISALEFGPFFRAQGVTPEQVRRFQDIWVKHTEQVIDLNAAGRLPGADPVAIKALREQANVMADTALTALFGAEGYRAFREFQSQLPLRNTVVYGFAGAAALEGVPITAEQGQRLFQAAVAVLSAPNAGGQSAGSAIERIDWDRLDAAARQILTPAQYTLFTTQAAPTGFSSRWKSQFEGAVRRAHAADVAAGVVDKPSP